MSIVNQIQTIFLYGNCREGNVLADCRTAPRECRWWLNRLTAGPVYTRFFFIITLDVKFEKC